MTRETFDLIIIVLIAAGLIAAALRLRADFTRPLPDDDEPSWAQDDTQPRR